MTKPTVTDAMVDIACDILINRYICGDQTMSQASRAAITAAIEASGWLELIAKADKMATSCEGLCDKTENLIPLADAACDYADQHCRAFPIATAPKKRLIQVWDTENKAWRPYCLIDNYKINSKFTHWAEYLPPPSNPPLPAVFVDLGAALEKIKEGK